MTEHESIVRELRRLSDAAARVILEVYQAPFDVRFKAPADPVTLADQRANELLVRELERAFPGVPVVAEESAPEAYASWASAGAAFFVDPVDGTSELVKKSGEFCTMLGYCEHGRPVLGVIGAPVLGRTFSGIVGRGAEVRAADGSARPLRVAEHDFEAGLAVVSRSHRAEPTDRALDRLRIGAREQYGSAGLKAMRVADGSALVYVHAGYAGARWDAAAPEAIARAAGASYTDLEGNPYRYDDGELPNARGVLALPERLAEEALRRLRGGS
jgi:3'(2'), 5'-bisphosphate nucleotidase